MTQLDWIHQFDLFLFDFDGLLVDTEGLHFRAYQMLCETYGEKLPWDFDAYCNIAHMSSEKLQAALRQEVPGMFIKEPSWEVLYNIKKASYDRLLKAGELTFLPGVQELLTKLNEIGKPRAIVTHSPRPFIEFIADKLPLLKTIPQWITRENYLLPKPAPDGYLKALEIFQIPADKTIGFEDSPRGLESLQQAKVNAVVINRKPHANIQRKQVVIFEDFCSIPAEGPLSTVS